MCKYIYSGIVLCCPRCGWEPKSELFIHFTINFYKRGKELEPLRCNSYSCNYSSTIEDWLTFYVDF